MTKSLSMDLRERIVARIEGGESRRRTAALFGVSVSSAIRFAQRKRDTGSVAAKKRGRPSGSGKLSTHVEFLLELVRNDGDITSDELAAALEEAHGVTADPSSIRRILREQGHTYKKRRSSRQRRPALTSS